MGGGGSKADPKPSPLQQQPDQALTPAACQGKSLTPSVHNSVPGPSASPAPGAEASASSAPPSGPAGALPAVGEVMRGVMVVEDAGARTLLLHKVLELIATSAQEWGRFRELLPSATLGPPPGLGAVQSAGPPAASSGPHGPPAAAASPSPFFACLFSAHDDTAAYDTVVCDIVLHALARDRAVVVRYLPPSVMPWALASIVSLLQMPPPDPVPTAAPDEDALPVSHGSVEQRSGAWRDGPKGAVVQLPTAGPTPDLSPTSSEMLGSPPTACSPRSSGVAPSDPGSSQSHPENRTCDGPQGALQRVLKLVEALSELDEFARPFHAADGLGAMGSVVALCPVPLKVQALRVHLRVQQTLSDRRGPDLGAAAELLTSPDLGSVEAAAIVIAAAGADGALRDATPLLEALRAYTSRLLAPSEGPTADLSPNLPRRVLQCIGNALEAAPKTGAAAAATDPPPPPPGVPLQPVVDFLNAVAAPVLRDARANPQAVAVAATHSPALCEGVTVLHDALQAAGAGGAQDPALAHAPAALLRVVVAHTTVAATAAAAPHAPLQARVMETWGAVAARTLACARRWRGGELAAVRSETCLPLAAVQARLLECVACLGTSAATVADIVALSAVLWGPEEPLDVTASHWRRSVAGLLAEGLAGMLLAVCEEPDRQWASVFQGTVGLLVDVLRFTVVHQQGLKQKELVIACAQVCQMVDLSKLDEAVVGGRMKQAIADLNVVAKMAEHVAQSEVEGDSPHESQQQWNDASGQEAHSAGVEERHWIAGTGVDRGQQRSAEREAERKEDGVAERKEEREAERKEEGVAERKGVGEAERKGVGEAERKEEEEAERKEEGEAERKEEGEAERKAVGEAESKEVGEAERKEEEEAGRKEEGEAERKAVGEAERKGVGEAERKEEGEAERKAVGEAERKGVGEAERKEEGKAERKAVGEAERKGVGEAERKEVGEAGRKGVGEAERKGVGEAERKEVGEAERKEEGEAERKGVGEAERKGVGEAERKEEGEAERKEEGEAERKEVGEAERKEEGVAERKEEGKAERKGVGEAERKGVGVAERKEVGEAERKEEEEAGRKAVGEAESKEVGEAERKEEEEAGRKEEGEAERKAVGEAERKGVGEAERKEEGEAERKEVGKAERKEVGEAERKGVGEAERKAVGEAERKEEEEAGRKEEGEAERKAVGEAERKEVGEAERKEEGEAERKGVGEAERKEVGEAERKEVGEAGRKEVGEAERKEEGEAERKEEGVAERKEEGKAERKGVGEAERKGVGVAERKEEGEAERKEVGEAERKEVGEAERKEEGKAERKEEGEAERKEEGEAERKEEGEAERKEEGEAERKGVGEAERKEEGEAERKGVGEAERKEEGEAERKEEGEAERKEEGVAERKEEGKAERKGVGEAERKGVGEAERKEEGEAERKEVGEAERKGVGEAERKEEGEAERKEVGKAERKEVGEAERKGVGEAERKEEGEAERKEVGEAERKGVGEAERKGVGEAERKEVGKAERKEVGEAERKGVGEAERKEVGEAERKGVGPGDDDVDMSLIQHPSAANQPPDATGGFPIASSRPMDLLSIIRVNQDVTRLQAIWRGASVRSALPGLRAACHAERTTRANLLALGRQEAADRQGVVHATAVSLGALIEAQEQAARATLSQQSAGAYVALVAELEVCTRGAVAADWRAALGAVAEEMETDARARIHVDLWCARRGALEVLAAAQRSCTEAELRCSALQICEGLEAELRVGVVRDVQAWQSEALVRFQSLQREALERAALRRIGAVAQQAVVCAQECEARQRVARLEAVARDWHGGAMQIACDADVAAVRLVLGVRRAMQAAVHQQWLGAEVRCREALRRGEVTHQQAAEEHALQARARLLQRMVAEDALVAHRIASPVIARLLRVAVHEEAGERRAVVLAQRTSHAQLRLRGAEVAGRCAVARAEAECRVQLQAQWQGWLAWLGRQERQRWAVWSDEEGRRLGIAEEQMALRDPLGREVARFLRPTPLLPRQEPPGPDAPDALDALPTPHQRWRKSVQRLGIFQLHRAAAPPPPKPKRVKRPKQLAPATPRRRPGPDAAAAARSEDFFRVRSAMDTMLDVHLHLKGMDVEQFLRQSGGRPPTRLPHEGVLAPAAAADGPALPHTPPSRASAPPPPHQYTGSPAEAEGTKAAAAAAAAAAALDPAAQPSRLKSLPHHGPRPHRAPAAGNSRGRPLKLRRDAFEDVICKNLGWKRTRTALLYAGSSRGKGRDPYFQHGTPYYKTISSDEGSGEDPEPLSHTH